MVSNRPCDAAEIETRLSSGRGLLSNGGVSIGNLFSGDAAESILTMSQLSHGAAALGPTRSWFYFFVSPFGFARALSSRSARWSRRSGRPAGSALRGIEPRVHRGGAYPVLRGVTNVLLRDVNVVAHRRADDLRGAPVIYADFVDYDEIAHHAGPERGRSRSTRSIGVDQVLGTLEQVAADAPRAVPVRRPLRPRAEPGRHVPAALRAAPSKPLIREPDRPGPEMVAATVDRRVVGTRSTRS